MPHAHANSRYLEHKWSGVDSLLCCHVFSTSFDNCCHDNRPTTVSLKGRGGGKENRVQIYAYLIWVVYNYMVFTASGGVVLSVLTVSE